MCEAMGRNIVSVILGGAGTVVAPKGEAIEYEGEITTTTVDMVADALAEAKNVIITPGYGTYPESSSWFLLIKFMDFWLTFDCLIGLAVAQAQFAIADIAKQLNSMGKNVRFG